METKLENVAQFAVWATAQMANHNADRRYGLSRFSLWAGRHEDGTAKLVVDWSLRYVSSHDGRFGNSHRDVHIPAEIGEALAKGLKTGQYNDFTGQKTLKGVLALIDKDSDSVSLSTVVSEAVKTAKANEAIAKRNNFRWHIAQKFMELQEAMIQYGTEIGVSDELMIVDDSMWVKLTPEEKLS